ncbi:SDR family oxidoreductase [Fodinicola feengrottensis]|uniref:SDR family oxidoreductase n=1 Tax=Fodinicola feengrottensis TaxID=435914 RepID=UPI0036F3CD93
MIVLTGATGTVGGYLAVKLAERGHPARAIVRDLGRAQPLRQLGLDIIPGDMARPATLGRARSRVRPGYSCFPRISRVRRNLRPRVM